MTTSDNLTTPKKRCSKCKRELPATSVYFTRHTGTKDGWYYSCKECRGSVFGEYVPPQASQEGHRCCRRCLREFPATTEHFNRDKSRQDGLHQWCKTCVYERHRQRHTEDPEKYREHRRRLYLKNLEKERAKQRKYKREHPEKRRAHEQARKARKLALPATFTSEQWQDCLNWWHGVCAYCGSQQTFWNVLSQDHYEPMTLGGGYTADNIVPACGSCNSQKRSSEPTGWVKRKFKHKAKAKLDRIQQYFEWVKSQP